MPTTNYGYYYPDSSTSLSLVTILAAMAASSDLAHKKVPVPYGTVSARNVAIPSPTEGRVVVTTDYDILWVYTGTQWRHVGSPSFDNSTSRDAQITQPLAGDLCSVAGVQNFYTGTAWREDYTLLSGQIVTAQTAADNALSLASTPLYGAKAKATTNQSYSATTWVKVAFDTSVYDDSGTGVDLSNETLVIPATGRYVVNAVIQHPNSYNSEHTRIAAIMRGNSSPDASPGNILSVSGGRNPGVATYGTWFANMSATDQFTAGDLITVWFYANPASNFGISSTVNHTVSFQQIK